MIGNHLQITKTMARQHMANGVVDAVADHLHLDAMQPGLGHKAGEMRVDFDGVEMGLQFSLAHVQQSDLTLHALTRANIAALPGFFQLLPARLAKAIEQGVRHVEQADRAIEVALHHPARAGLRHGFRKELNTFIHGS